MKHIILYLVTIFTALVLAAPPKHTARDVGTTPTTQSSNATLTATEPVVNNYPPYDPNAEGPDPDAGFFADTEDDDGEERPSVEELLAQLENLTSSDWNVSFDASSHLGASTSDTIHAAGASLGKPDKAKPGEYAVAIRIGPDTEHVGTLRKNRMYDAVYSCLKDLNEGKQKYWGCWIPNIVMNTNPGSSKPKYEGGHYLEMVYWWPRNDHKVNPDNKLLEDLTVSDYIMALISSRLTF